MKALVTNARLKNSLAIVRSLGKKGIEVFAADDWGVAPTFFSKYCKGHGSYTGPLKDSEKFVEDLSDFLSDESFDVLFPVGADTTIPASYYKEKLEKYSAVPVANYETIVKAHDKWEASKTANRLGIPTPKTCCPEDPHELEGVSEETRFPLVIKARRGSGVDLCVNHANSEKELLEGYKNIEKNSERNTLAYSFSRPIVQEYVPGKIHDVCVLFNEGEPRAALTQIREKTVPPRGGPGVANRTTDIPELKDLAIELLREIEWHGVAQVEFKHDQRDDKFKLLEINSKFWGTLDLSIRAGIDFPHLLFKLTTQGDVEPKFDYKKNLKFHWPFPDEAMYVGQSSSKWKDLREFCKWGGDNLSTNIKSDDWAPNLFQIIATPYKVLTG